MLNDDVYLELMRLNHLVRALSAQVTDLKARVDAVEHAPTARLELEPV